jgi:hypothetical protein
MRRKDRRRDGNLKSFVFRVQDNDPIPEKLDLRFSEDGTPSMVNNAESFLNFVFSKWRPNKPSLYGYV